MGPYLDDQPPTAEARSPAPTVPAGDTLTVYGHWYTTTCNDTGGQAPLRRMGPVRLSVTFPGGAVDDLGTFTPSGRDMGFSAVVRIPAGMPAGNAEVRDGRRFGARFDFEVGTPR